MANETFKLMPRELREAGYPIARFLSEEEQARYDEEIKQYKDKARDSLRVSLNGSNLFKVLLLNQIGIRTATLPELECALENGMNLRETYEDAPSVILRSSGDSYAPNDYIAKDLTKKLGLKSFKAPKIINGLRIVEDKDSAYGLNFDTKDAQIIEAPDFDNRNNQRKFLRINPDYSIEFDNNATRTLYTRDSGLSGLCLNRYLDAYSNDEDLADSDEYGRVVVVSGEAAS